MEFNTASQHKHKGACTAALFGASGNMGQETLRQLLELDRIEKVKVLILPEETKTGRRFQKIYKNRVCIIYGDIADPEACRQIIEGSQYVLNLAAVIPPRSDKYPGLSERCNYIGAKNIADCIVSMGDNQPKLVHISTVALYGNRNHLHPWGRVGDPLLISPYDAYAAAKLRGERYVLESRVRTWAVIRQTAMLHSRMLTDNMSDGLMFHTCYNTPLEWATARDSGLLMKRIIECDMEEDLGNEFWMRCFNLGSRAENRIIGYNTFDDGFKLIGGSAQKFLKPNWNATRNFHGLWYYDGDRLEKLFGYQKESVADYWNEILAAHPYYALAKPIPPKVISFFAIQRLLSNYNSPMRWRKTGQTGKIKAYFGSEEAYDALPKDWKDFPLLCADKAPDGSYLDYNALRDIRNAELLLHGYDDTKADSELTAEDMRQAAQFRGGRLISESMTRGDMYTKLEWECADGHRFTASPYTVVRAGHWCASCTPPYTWDFDRLSKSNPFYAQAWYDSHAQDEDMLYWFDRDFNACCRKLRPQET